MKIPTATRTKGADPECQDRAYDLGAQGERVDIKRDDASGNQGEDLREGLYALRRQRYYDRGEELDLDFREGFDFSGYRYTHRDELSDVRSDLRMARQNVVVVLAVMLFTYVLKAIAFADPTSVLGVQPGQYGFGLISCL